MGKRYRQKTRRHFGDGEPIANRLLRSARTAVVQKDEELARIAEQVYVVGAEVKEAGGVQLPLAVYAPLRAAVELASIAMTRQYGLAQKLGVTENEAREAVADYLVAWFIEMVASLRVDHFVEWYQRMRGLERGEAYGDDGRYAGGFEPPAAHGGAPGGAGGEAPGGGPQGEDSGGADAAVGGGGASGRGTDRGAGAPDDGAADSADVRPDDPA